MFVTNRANSAPCVKRQVVGPDVCLKCVNLNDKVKNLEQKYLTQSKENKQLNDANLTCQKQCDALTSRNQELSEKLEQTTNAYNDLRKSVAENMEDACSQFAAHISEKNDDTDRIRNDADYFRAESKFYRDQVEELKNQNKHLQLLHDTHYTTIRNRYERQMARVERESFKRAEDEMTLRLNALIASKTVRNDDDMNRSAFSRPSSRELSNSRPVAERKRKRRSRIRSNGLHDKRLSLPFDPDEPTPVECEDADVQLINVDDNKADVDESECQIVFDENANDRHESTDDEIVCLGERKSATASRSSFARRSQESALNSFGFRGSRIFGSVDFSRLRGNYQRMRTRTLNGNRSCRSDENLADEPAQQPVGPVEDSASRPVLLDFSALSVLNPTQNTGIEPTQFHFAPPPTSVIQRPACVNVETMDEAVEAPVDFNWVQDYYEENNLSASTETTESATEQPVLVEEVPVEDVLVEEDSGVVTDVATVEHQSSPQVVPVEKVATQNVSAEDSGVVTDAPIVPVEHQSSSQIFLPSVDDEEAELLVRDP